MLIKIYDIPAAIKLVYTVPSHRTVSGGPNLRSRNISEKTLLSLIIRVPGGFRGVFFPPLKPPSPPISVNKCLIVRCCHDKRLRIFRLWYDCFSLFLLLFFFSSLFQSKWPFFVFSQKYSSSNRNFKNKNSRIFRPSFAILFHQLGL